MSRTKTATPTARGRRVPKNWKPVGRRAIAAAALIALVLVSDVAETIADVSGAAALDNVLLWVNAGAMLVAAVAFIRWLWRARANAELLVGPHGQRLTREWVIGAWICPVVNLWFPYRVVVDVWRASTPNRGDYRDDLVAWWWLAFLVSWLFTRFITLAGVVDAVPLIAACALDVAAGVLALLVIRKITAWQSVPRV